MRLRSTGRVHEAKRWVKEMNSELELNGNSGPQKTSGKSTGRKSGQAKAAKLLAELEHYRMRVADNEERLRTGKAYDGTPLTDLQRTNLEEIIERQRQRILDLSS